MNTPEQLSELENIAEGELMFFEKNKISKHLYFYNYDK